MVRPAAMERVRHPGPASAPQAAALCYLRSVMPEAAPKPDTVERVKTLLRRDLKLGPDAVIEDDTPLMGGEYDLDSLDVLLIVTSVEKEFGFKIPNESVGKDAFRSITTLASYIDERVGT